MSARILLIETKRADHLSFGPALLKKGYQVESVPNGGTALSRLEQIDPDLVVVDAASMRTSGRRICQALRRELDGLPVVLISDEDHDAVEKSSEKLAEKNDVANVVLIPPFTVQKLANRIRALLPPEERDLLHVGPIRLNTEQKKVRCLGKQSKLNPRLVKLLKVLLEHPGEVLEREKLFRMVWDTEYTGDTRTLDVHISWLRAALETDPRRPRFLKTVRGIGYRLDI